MALMLLPCCQLPPPRCLRASAIATLLWMRQRYDMARYDITFSMPLPMIARYRLLMLPPPLAMMLPDAPY